MDAKNQRIESALGAHNDDGNPKYAQSGTTLQINGNKPYDIGSNSLAKVDVPSARPCAIIGPDRVVPPQPTKDVYMKKLPVEPWTCGDNIYHQNPSEYSHKSVDYHPPRNISPRQTFQENMQRIMVPPTYASVKTSEEHSLKNPKLMPLEVKYCDVPYSISPISNEPKIVKNSEESTNNNSVPHFSQQSWVGSGVNSRPLGPYGAPELYQYSEYANCPAPRPISMIRPQRNVHNDFPHVYQDRFYHEANLRFKPYPTTKERTHQHPQPRYDYIPNYPNTFHPHIPYPLHKYEMQKSTPPHPYSVFPQVKYLDRRMPAPTMEKYVRPSSQQLTFNTSFCNRNIPPNYGSVSANCLQNRAYPYTSDAVTKSMIQNRMYIDNNVNKYYRNSENLYINDINRPQTLKNDVLYPVYPPINLHPLPPHLMYRKENSTKGYEHTLHYGNIDYPANMNTLSRLPLQFSPQTMSISPADSNTSIDTTQTLGNTHEDCGYVSQSSTTSIRSIESGANRLARDMYRKPSNITRTGQKSSMSSVSKDKKGLDLRQFLQTWNEGDDEGTDNNKETTVQHDIGHYESGTNQEQLYVLGSVNVPNEDLGKYDHIQKISKLPENIKGYNSIELLNQYEKLVESPGINNYSLSPSQTKQINSQLLRNNVTRQGMDMQPRPMSPLDVEAKISQSVIHKEVGCNFEIRPCSPQMLNVETATPVHSVLGERLIEKVANPVTTKSPIHRKIDEANKDILLRSSPKVPSCKMVSNQYPSNIPDSLKTVYSLQDLESSSGVCLASLPRLDNDIELNFPEINQQFIDANKIDSTKISSTTDLPVLDTENSALKSISKISFVSEDLNLGSESDKEVTKLSKYRKHKRSSSIANENETNLNQSILHRTDSVIIKNPDNYKSQEDAPNHSTLIINTPDNGNKTNPLNDLLYDKKITIFSDGHFRETHTERFYDYTPINTDDAAIDFSVNKIDVVQRKDLNECNINLDSNTHIETENFNLRDKNIPPQKMCGSEDLHLQNNSPILSNITYTNVQSVDENSLIATTHETVITHSNPKIEDFASAIATEDIILHDNLPILIQEPDSLNVITPKKNVTENNPLLSNSMGNLEIDNCLAKETHNGISPICKVKPNGVVEDVSDKKITNGTDVENNLNKGKTASVSIIDNVPSLDTNANLNLCTNSNDNQSNHYINNTTNDSRTKKYQTTACEPKFNTETKLPFQYTEKEVHIVEKQTGTESQTATHNIDKEIFTPEGEYEKKINSSDKINLIYARENQDTKAQTLSPTTKEEMFVHGRENMKTPFQAIGQKISQPENENKNIEENLIKMFIPGEDNENSNEFENCNHEYTVNQELTNTSKVITGHESVNLSVDTENENCDPPFKYNNDFKVISINDFVPSITHCNDIVIDNCKLVDEIKTENKFIDTTDTLSCLSYKNAVIEKPKISNEFTFKKELFSPWLQMLIMHTDGFCTTTKGSEVQSHSEINQLTQMHSCYQQAQNKHKTLVKPNVNKDIVVLETSSRPPDYRDVHYKSTIGCKAKSIISTKSVLDDQGANERIQSNIVIDSNSGTQTETNSIVESNHFDHESAENIIVDNDAQPNLTFEILTKEPILSLAEQLSNNPLRKRGRALKRSLSESATAEYNVTTDSIIDNNLVFANKRSKIDNSEILLESQIITHNFSGFMQNNRRNSTSTIYNDENVSYCILIDNDCVLAEDNEKVCYTEIPEDCLATVCTEADGATSTSELSGDITYLDSASVCQDQETPNSQLTEEIVCYEDSGIICDEQLHSELKENLSYHTAEASEYGNEFIIQSMEDNKIKETWVEDVACMETIFSEDIAENIVISAPSSHKDSDLSEEEIDNTNFHYNINENAHKNKVKNIYGNQMCDDDARLVDKLYRTPQMDVNKTLIDRESQLAAQHNRYYDNESLEKVLSESNTLDTTPLAQKDTVKSSTLENSISSINKSNIKRIYLEQGDQAKAYSSMDLTDVYKSQVSNVSECKKYEDLHSSELICDNFVSYNNKENPHYAISSSPEVSSTTAEEKSAGILLKIRSYKGSKISEVNEMGDNLKFNKTQPQRLNSLPISRPLITKAAQKYIPPLKETIRDLKVKIRLPPQSLYKLQQLKKSKKESKLNTKLDEHYIKNFPKECPKIAKPKPKFEDVLKSIDEIQFKKHKEKHKKIKQPVPKLIIKKNENGAHFTSTSKSKDTFNPDLTGRKWQPWVFLEKSTFIDKMAIKKNFKAIYSHRKKTYVLADSFRKYKSISNAKFVITHPKSSDCASTGKLKYTFKLTHN